MALDKAIDSAKLNAALSYEAARIRAKTGSAAALHFGLETGKGFGDAIDAISGSAVPDWLENVSKLTLSLDGATISDDLVIDLGSKNCTLQNFLKNAQATNENTSVEIKAHSVGTVSNIGQNCQKIRTLFFRTQVSPKSGSQCIFSTSIYRVLGTPIELTGLGGTGTYSRINSPGLVEIYFLPNTCSSEGRVATGELTDASLISLANALQATTGQTITIDNAATKAKCNTIIGNISSLSGSSGTYDFFTADANGTATLTEFITLTKGWTLA